MKTQIQRPGQAQDPQQWQELATADPGYREWHDARNAEDHQAFDAWLDSPEGLAWINAKAETEDERNGITIWNHDGFSSDEGCRYAH